MDRWLVWSNDDRLWWCAERRGYTRFVADAGRYTLAEAQAIATGHHEDCEDDQPNSFPKIAIQPSPEMIEHLRITRPATIKSDGKPVLYVALPISPTLDGMFVVTIKPEHVHKMKNLGATTMAPLYLESHDAG